MMSEHINLLTELVQLFVNFIHDLIIPLVFNFIEFGQLLLLFDSLFVFETFLNPFLNISKSSCCNTNEIVVHYISWISVVLDTGRSIILEKLHFSSRDMLD